MIGTELQSSSRLGAKRTLQIADSLLLEAPPLKKHLRSDEPIKPFDDSGLRSMAKHEPTSSAHEAASPFGRKQEETPATEEAVDDVDEEAEGSSEEEDFFLSASDADMLFFVHPPHVDGASCDMEQMTVDYNNDNENENENDNNNDSYCELPSQPSSDDDSTGNHSSTDEDSRCDKRDIRLRAENRMAYDAHCSRSELSDGRRHTFSNEFEMTQKGTPCKSCKFTLTLTVTSEAAFVTVRCHGDECAADWRILADIGIQLAVNQRRVAYHHRIYRFDHAGLLFEFDPIPWSEHTSVSSFAFKLYIIIGARITGLPNNPALNFCQANSSTDISFVFRDGRKLHANLNYLTRHSLLFLWIKELRRRLGDRLFYEPFHCENIRYEDMFKILAFIHTRNSTVKVEDAPQLLKLAWVFGIPSLSDKCRTVINDAAEDSILPRPSLTNFGILGSLI